MDAQALQVGVGFRPQHIHHALAVCESGWWWEAHPENYMVDGGPRLNALLQLRQRQPLALHSVSLSLGGPHLPSPNHLARLHHLVQKTQPWMVSDHLAWSGLNGVYVPDLLPITRTTERLQQIVRNIDCAQHALGRTIALENPSHYIDMAHADEWSELDFLTELQRRTGCHLLLDLNNVVVSAHNLGFNANDYVAQFPGHAVAEIHLAGYSIDPHWGDKLWVDSHDQPVSHSVWSLLKTFVHHFGKRPVLIERDDADAPWQDLLQDHAIAQSILMSRDHHAQC